MQTAGLGTQTVPACCVGAFPILDEIKDLEPEALDWQRKSISESSKEELDTYRDDRFDSTTPERNEAAKSVFNKLRPECHKWFPYTPGLSPEKHLQEFRMQQLEQDRRAFELELFKMSQDIQENSNKSNKRVTWLFVVLAIVAILIAVLVATPDSLVVSWVRSWFS